MVDNYLGSLILATDRIGTSFNLISNLGYFFVISPGSEKELRLIEPAGLCQSYIPLGLKILSSQKLHVYFACGENQSIIRNAEVTNPFGPNSAVLKNFVYSSSHSFTEVIMYSPSRSFVDYNPSGTTTGGAPFTINCATPISGTIVSTNSLTRITMGRTATTEGLWMSVSNVALSDLMVEMISISPLV